MYLRYARMGRYGRAEYRCWHLCRPSAKANVASVERPALCEGCAKRKAIILAWCSSVESVKWHKWLCRDGRQEEPQRDGKQAITKLP